MDSEKLLIIVAQNQVPRDGNFLLHVYVCSMFHWVICHKEVIVFYSRRQSHKSKSKVYMICFV